MYNDNGLKLMEHSYIGNNFVNAVMTQLWKQPMKVAWIGDYSNDAYGDPYMIPPFSFCGSTDMNT